MYDLVIRGGTLVTCEGIYRADLAIQGEKIAEIAPHLNGKQIISALGKLVLPGGVDPHVHFEMPTPLTVTSDTWETGSKAAAFGGTTTVIDFVETSYPHQPLLDAFQERLRCALGKSAIDFCFHMTLQTADADTLQQAAGVIEAGMPSFKLYTTYDGFRLTDEELLAAFEEVERAHGLAIVHAESDAIIRHAIQRLKNAGDLTVSDFPKSRPDCAEKEAVERVLSLAACVGAPVYIVHVSTRDAAKALSRARQNGQAAWGETCPQYLMLDESRIKTDDFSGAKFICCPPLRSSQDQQALWSALQEGSLQTIGTDHCAFNFNGQKDLGRDSILEIPPGLPGVELRLALLYTYGVKTGRLSLQQWVALCCTSPARLFGLYPRKGELAPGSDADIVIFDPNYSETITHYELHEYVDYTPYEGMQLDGRVETTLLRGRFLVRDGEWAASNWGGKFVPGVPFSPKD
jgi:dihydropyrimidinase